MYFTGSAEVSTRALRASIKWGLTGAVVLSLTAGLAGLMADPAWARTGDKELPSVAVTQLPTEAQGTYQLIYAGGPFPYPKDGTVFLNRERVLPPQPRGFYREYTVKTPRSRDRGARRIVCGGKPPTAPQACYYTADHYTSFSRITTAAP